jgi:hypothetical protein
MMEKYGHEDGGSARGVTARCSEPAPRVRSENESAFTEDPGKGLSTCNYLVGDTGFEPVTSSVSKKTVRANVEIPAQMFDLRVFLSAVAVC